MEQTKLMLVIFGRCWGRGEGEGRLSTGVGWGVTVHGGRAHGVPERDCPWAFTVFPYLGKSDTILCYLKLRNRNILTSYLRCS